MNDFGSVAPKERVNILYKPAVGEAKEGVELPLKLLVLGDFSRQEQEAPIEERELTDIGKENFNEVMAGFDLSLECSVPNRLIGDGESNLDISLKFSGMRDFDPQRIAEQVPELQKILELRHALMALKGPLGNVPAMRKTIQGMLKDDDTRARLMAELGIEA